jgi:hypothetical protein
MMRLSKVREYMKVLKTAIVLGVATVAISANAQFGAANKSEFSMDAGKQGLYGTYNPFVRVSSGGSSGNGYAFSLEKLTSDDTVIGGWFSRVEGATSYQLHYRKYSSADTALQIGLLGGDGFNNKNDFSLLYIKEMAKKSETGLNTQLFGGLYYDSTDSKFDLQAGAKASYALQSGLSIDATFWYARRAGDSANVVTVGIGYRF